MFDFVHHKYHLHEFFFVLIFVLSAIGVIAAFVVQFIFCIYFLVPVLIRFDTGECLFKCCFCRRINIDSVSFLKFTFRSRRAGRHSTKKKKFFFIRSFVSSKYTKHNFVFIDLVPLLSNIGLYANMTQLKQKNK